MRFRLAFCALLLTFCFSAKGQNVAIKTNLLYDAFANVNAGIEFGLAPKWTLDLSGDLNTWRLKRKDQAYWKHIIVQPEARYWFCDRFAGHFLGIHALGGFYNANNLPHLPVAKMPIDVQLSNLENYRYQGWLVGAGIAYGYAFVLGKHWNLEMELGAGYVYTKYDQYECGDCGKELATDQKKNYIGPTKAAVNIVYVF